MLSAKVDASLKLNKVNLKFSLCTSLKLDESIKDSYSSIFVNTSLSSVSTISWKKGVKKTLYSLGQFQQLEYSSNIVSKSTSFKFTSSLLEFFALMLNALNSWIVLLSVF
ncbi:MAG: hypothetical protein ABF311_06985 [Polaribacter sp.]